LKRLYAIILIGAGLIFFRDAAELATRGDQARDVQTAQARYEAGSTGIR
jgi:hypothetical protein